MRGLFSVRYLPDSLGALAVRLDDHPIAYLECAVPCTCIYTHTCSLSSNNLADRDLVRLTEGVRLSKTLKVLMFASPQLGRR